MRVNPSLRTIRSAVVLATLTSALAFGSAAAAGPVKTPNAANQIVWDAGVLCAFEVVWDIPAVGSTMVYPVTADGDQLVRQAGRMLTTVTNSASGASIDLKGGMKLDLVFHSDGSLDAHISGTILAGYFPTDVGGPSMWFYRGHLHDVLMADFTAVGHSFSGHATDLCAALS